MFSKNDSQIDQPKKQQQFPKSAFIAHIKILHYYISKIVCSIKILEQLQATSRCIMHEKQHKSRSSFQLESSEAGAFMKNIPDTF